MWYSPNVTVNGTMMFEDTDIFCITEYTHIHRRISLDHVILGKFNVRMVSLFFCLFPKCIPGAPACGPCAPAGAPGVHAKHCCKSVEVRSEIWVF